MASATLEQEETDGEVLGSLTRAQELPPNLMLLRMENETIMSAAAVRPRDPMKIVEQLKQLIEAYPAAADEAIYSKPVGKVTRIECQKCKVKYEVIKVDNETCCPACNSREKGQIRQVQKYAEGLSIRAAESIRSIFGYTRMATTCEMLDNGDARISGTLVDYSAGNMTSDERIVSRRYKAYGGEIKETPIDRFVNVVIKAEKSKLRRDIILDSTPAIIKALFRDECEKRLKQLVSPEQVDQVIIPAFAEFGLNREHVESLIGRPASMGWKEEERLHLRKILSALKTEETTAAELLGDMAGRNTSGGASQPKVKPSKLNDEPAKAAEEIAKQDAQDVDQTVPEGSPSQLTPEEEADLQREQEKPAAKGRRKQSDLLDKGGEQYK